MTALPIPFITAFLLLLLVASNHRQLCKTSTGRVFGLSLYLSAASMLCIGFRWSYNLIYLMPVAACLSVLAAAFLYLAFRSLGKQGEVIRIDRDWKILLPAILLPASLLIGALLLEIVLVCIKVVYSALLFNLARKAPESLRHVRFSWLRYAQQALWGSAFLLLFSAAVDTAIAVDFALYNGTRAASIVGYANLLIVVLLGWISVVAGQGRSIYASTTVSEKTNELNLTSENDENKAQDEQVLQRLNHLLVDDQLYTDTELNLQKLARKAGVPTRTVSRVVNKQANQNVSQWINSARINAACEQLKNNKLSITEVMELVGFVTKSNFNREFRRLKGCSPSEWRSSFNN